MGVITGRIVGASGPTALPVPTVGQVVESAVALRALVGSAALPAVAMVQYAGSTLLGGGVFVWRTTAANDDGVTRFNAGGLGSSGEGWQRVFTGPLTLHMGGATGDGVTDDTAAVQRVLAAAASLGVAVHVPIGTYKVTAQLTVTSSVAAPLTLYGDGPSSHINSVIAGTNTTAIAASGASFSNAIIRDLRVSGTFSRGLLLVAASGSNVRVERCTISGHTAFAGGVTLAAVMLGGLDDVWLVDNVISGGGYDNGDGSGHGYDILKNSGALQSRIHCLGNKVTGSNTCLGITLFDCADSEVRGNYVDQGNTPSEMGPPVKLGYGITMYDTLGAGTCRRNIVADNIVVNCAGMGVYMALQPDAVVADNICRDTCKQITDPSLPLGAISVNRGVAAITGNVVKTTTGGTHGIIWTQPSAVTGNRVDGVSACLAPSSDPDTDASGSAVSGNVCVDSVHGVLLNGVTLARLSVTGNAFAAVQAPLSVQPGAVLSDSTFSHNTSEGAQVGVLLEAGSNNTIQGNHIDGSSSWGIQVMGDLNNVVDNVVRGSTADGGILVSGDYCRVERNEATGNTGPDISITGTSCLEEGNRTSTVRASDDGAQGRLATGPAFLVSGQWHIQYRRLQLTSTQRLTLAGTARYILTDL